VTASEKPGAGKTANKIKEESSGKPPPTASLQQPGRAELVWDGKYDANGRRIAPLRVALPFQTVETVNETAQERQRAFSFDSPAYHPSEWRNRLIWGDKKYVLPSLLAEFAGKVNLEHVSAGLNRGIPLKLRIGESSGIDAIFGGDRCRDLVHWTCVCVCCERSKRARRDARQLNASR